MSMIIRNGQVFDRASAALRRADVLIDDDRIVEVGPDLTTPAGVEVIDAADRIVLPGLINAHTHGASNIMRGVADNWTLEDLLNYGAATNFGRTPQDQYLSVAIGAIEMLKTGCTAAYDLFAALPAATTEGVEAVFRAYTDVGMRAVLAPMVADIVFYETVPGLKELLPDDLRATVEGMEAAPTAGLLRLTEDAIRRWDGSANGRIRAAVAPTIPGQSTDELLTGSMDLVREYGVGFHTHLVESKVQVVHAHGRWGKSVVAQLSEMGVLGPHFIGAHGVWLTPEDIEMLARAEANVVHNPASNLKLGVGIAPVREMLAAGLNVGLGTDGSTCSDNQDMYEMLKFAASLDKVRAPHQPDSWLGSRAVWDLATKGNARVLGMADDLGAVEAGRKADLALLRADSVFLRPLNDLLNALVYAETGSSVDKVLVDGKLVVDGGRVLTVDEDRLREQARDAAERLMAGSERQWLLADQISPYLRQACRSAALEPCAVDRYAVPVGTQA